MATLSQSLANFYTSTMIIFSIILLDVSVFVYGIVKTSTRKRSITTMQFLKIVDQKVPARRFETGLGANFEPSESCRVCLSLFEEGDEIRRLKCKHTFHKWCVDTWLQRDVSTCPLCREVVLPPEVVVNHRSHQDQQEYYHDDDGGDEALMVLYALHGSFLRSFL